MKIWSLPKHENLTTGKKYCGKEEKLLLSRLFSQYFQYISNFMSPITYKFVKCSYTNYFFLNSANLICRSTDISKYFRESLGIRDNESRLYTPVNPTFTTCVTTNWLCFMSHTISLSTGRQDVSGKACRAKKNQGPKDLGIVWWVGGMVCRR